MEKSCRFSHSARLTPPLLLYLLLLSPYTGLALDCPLKWVQGQLGSVPLHAVESGPGEYVSRVYDVEEEAWKVGKLRPSQKEMFLFMDGSVWEFKSYEILTNPDNCILEWLPSSRTQTVLPDGIVETGKGEVRYVGRGKVQGYVIAGTVEPYYGLLVTVAEEEEQVIWEYEVLVSKYPLLNAVIYELEFNPDTYIQVYYDSLMELVGSQFMYAQRFKNPNNPMDEELVTLDKRVPEKFVFRESNYDWSFLRTVNISFSPWFGSSDVSAFVHVENKSKFSIHRTVDMHFSEQIKHQDEHIYQVCCVIQVPENNIEVDFTAKMDVTAPNLSLSQIKHVLQKTGRTYIDEDEEFNTVTVQINGTMTGRYVIERGTFIVTHRYSACRAACHKLHRQRRSFRSNIDPGCIPTPFSQRGENSSSSPAKEHDPPMYEL